MQTTPRFQLFCVLANLCSRWSFVTLISGDLLTCLLIWPQAPPASEHSRECSSPLVPQLAALPHSIAVPGSGLGSCPCGRPVTPLVGKGPYVCAQPCSLKLNRVGRDGF